MNTELIEKEFPKEEIKTRKGSYGKTLTYVMSPSVIKRLNAISDYDWSFTIKDWEKTENDEIIVSACLELDGIKKEDFGGSQITKSKKNGKPINIVDDTKAAASDALKRTARLFGIGLHLWDDDHRKEKEKPETNKAEKKDSITDNQLKEIKSIRKKHSLSADQVQDKAQEMFSSSVMELNKKQAKALIDHLKKSFTNEVPF